MSDQVPLSTYANIIGGFAFKSEDFSRTGIPVVKIANILPPFVSLDSCDHISPEKLNGLDRFRLQRGDVLMAMTGATIGKAGRLRSDREAYLNQRVAKISAVGGREYDDFVWALVSQPGFERKVLDASNGSAQANISADAIGSILVPSFRPSLQKTIGRTIGALDDKIALNALTNQTLEALAHSLFRHHFPHDPDDELPQSWRTVTMPDMFEINPPRNLPAGIVAPYLEMANLPTASSRPTAWESRQAGSGMRFMNGDVLVARITPCLENGKTAFVDFLHDGQVGWGSTEYIVLRSKPPVPLEFAYLLARTDDFRAHVIQNMTGTSGRQRANADCLSEYEVVRPPDPELTEFGEQVAPLFRAIKANDDESRTLAAMRDALLPKLLSGELRIPMPEQSTEAPD